MRTEAKRGKKTKVLATTAGQWNNDKDSYFRKNPLLQGMSDKSTISKKQNLESKSFTLFMYKPCAPLYFI
jgi:hypothetical protein